MKERNVVTISGGTGGFVLLSGLKKYPLHITAIVSMADDGGSTGILRDELGVLPPGDVRQCLVALSESSAMMRSLMSYRFESGSLRGHSFGNIFLSALQRVNRSFSRGIEEAVEILKVKGEVIPVTEEDMRINIKLRDGAIERGEKQLDQSRRVKEVGLQEVFLGKRIRASRKAVAKIREADFIVIGPGDHYGSIMPNLMIGEISRAIRNSEAQVIYIPNLTNKRGQTEGWDVDDYVRDIAGKLGEGVVDYVLVNSRRPSPAVTRRYEEQEGKGAIVRFREKRVADRSYRIVRADLLRVKAIRLNRHDAIRETRSFIRHDSDKVARVIMGIASGAGR